MATCFDLNGTTLELSATPVETCTGYILQTTAEYQSNVTLATLFTVNPDNALMMFRAGFMLILFSFVMAWFWGTIINFFSEKFDSHN